MLGSLDICNKIIIVMIKIDNSRLLLIIFVRSIHRDIYVEMYERLSKMTNDNLFLAGVCNVSDIIFLMITKNNGINNIFL